MFNAFHSSPPYLRLIGVWKVIFGPNFFFLRQVFQWSITAFFKSCPMFIIHVDGSYLNKAYYASHYVCISLSTFFIMYTPLNLKQKN